MKENGLNAAPKLVFSRLEGDGAQLALEGATGTWEFDPATGEHVLSPRGRQLLGIAAEEPVSIERLLAALQPTDRQRWRDAMDLMLATQRGGEYRIELRTAGPAERRLVASGRAFFEGAILVRVVWTLYDIAEERSTEDERGTRLGQLAHDLRMPLSAISMGIQLVQRDVPAKAEILSSMKDTVRRMNRLIDQLLRYASRGGGQLVLNRELVALADICEEVIGEASLAYPGHPIEFEHYDDAPGEWDRDRLIQVVRNLLSNALRHGSSAEPIIVSVIDRGDQALLAVANRGQPIPAAFRGQLREPTLRREGSNEHLGLGIVKEIVSAHGGRIELRSGDDATVFYVWLPKWRESGVRRDDERRPLINRFRPAPRLELSGTEP